MRRGMRETDLRLHVVAQRRLLAHEAREDLMRQHLVDSPHTVGALRMSVAGIVLQKCRMREKERRHRPVAAFLRVAVGIPG